jgi:hypothetical protein
VVTAGNMMVETTPGGARIYGNAILPPPEYIFQCYVWPQLGLKRPGLPARLARAHAYIRGIDMLGDSNLFALVTCASMEIKDE